MDIHKAIGKLPRSRRGFVLPNHKYTGPYNPLHDQLDEYDRPVPGQEPYNAVDAISMRHDICYRDNPEDKHKCDDAMLQELQQLKPKGLREWQDKNLVRAMIGQKRKWGMGVADSGNSTSGGVKWSDELADELHKPARRTFPKRRVFAHEVDGIWTADLVDMQSFAKANKGYKYILMIIDVFSKYGWGIPLKTKTGVEVASAFENLWKKAKVPHPKKLWTDKGREFYNKSMNKLLSKNNIELYSTENEEKSSIVERWNRTIKRNMWKYFTANNTTKYIDVLPKIIAKYNTTYHRSIKSTPTLAREPSNRQHVEEALYGRKSPPLKRPKFKVGDRVRILKKKKTFEKGFTPSWTEELFTVSEVKRTNPPTYTIEDTKGESVQGTFYEQELQKTKQEIYRIEKVLKKRTTKDKVKEVYVKWRGYSNAFNSWIPLSGLYGRNSGDER